jgi:signal transduction histidine kinase
MPPPTPPALVACHAAELGQMVGELINNAVKYAPAATITTAVRVHQDQVVVEISDDGPGLSEQERASAATRFWRAPRHSSVRGTGLGMTIVGELAAANGGRLVLAPATPQGLSARVEFPAPTVGADPESGGGEARG